MTFPSGCIPGVCAVPGDDGDRELLHRLQQVDQQEEGQEPGGEEPC